MSDEPTEGVLAGFRVLDFGRYIAGPYCAALLADLGADVIRIERAGGGEDRWVAPVADDGAGAMFLVMNRNKRAMTLDPGSRDAAMLLALSPGNYTAIVNGSNGATGTALLEVYVVP